MCVPISVLTKGRVSGCQGLCTLWTQAGAIVALGSGLAWNIARNKTESDENNKKEPAPSKA